MLFTFRFTIPATSPSAYLEARIDQVFVTGYEPKQRLWFQDSAFRRLELRAMELQDEDVPDVKGIVGSSIW